MNMEKWNKVVVIICTGVVVVVTVGIIIQWRLGGDISILSRKDALPDAQRQPIAETSRATHETKLGLTEDIRRPNSVPRFDSIPTTIDGKVLRLIGDEKSPVFSSYSHVKGSLSENDVPLLRGLLEDQAYKNRWAQISKMLVWLCNNDDRESLQVLESYIRRDDSWRNSGSTPPATHLFGKAVTLGYVGLLKNEDATRLLRDAFSEEGARRIVHGWAKSPLPPPYEHSEKLIAVVRGHGALGLVLSRELENIDMVTLSVETYVHRTLSLQYQDAPRTEESDLDYREYSFAADALASNDLILDIGLEEFLKRHDSELGIHGKSRFLKKYLGKQLDSGSYLIEPCPMCGKYRDQ